MSIFCNNINIFLLFLFYILFIFIIIISLFVSKFRLDKILSRKYKKITIFIMLLTSSSGMFSKKANKEFYFFVEESDKEKMTRERDVFSYILLFNFAIMFIVFVLLLESIKKIC